MSVKNKTLKVGEVNEKRRAYLRRAVTTATMGGDPEFFVADKHGVILNADRFFPSKHAPIIIPKTYDQAITPDASVNKLYFDGIQAEIAPAFSSCRETLIGQIARLLGKAKWIIGADHDIVLKPAVKVKRSIIQAADPEARIFGCMPDFNAYTLSVNTPEMDASAHPYRYAGGHMHFGQSSPYLPKESSEYQMVNDDEWHPRIIKMLDLLVSIPTLSLDNAPGSKHRRDKYGKAGCFRPTPYGVEYRTPSCWWLQSPLTTSLVFGLGRLAWSLIAQGMDKEFLSYVSTEEEEVRGTIDESNVKNAMKIWKKMRPYVAFAANASVNPIFVTAAMSYGSIPFNTFVNNAFKSSDCVNKPEIVVGLAAFEYMMKNGVKSVIKTDDIAQAWGLHAEESGGKKADIMTLHAKYNGFVNGAYVELKGNKDFQSFQTSFWKECVVAS